MKTETVSPEKKTTLLTPEARKPENERNVMDKVQYMHFGLTVNHCFIVATYSKKSRKLKLRTMLQYVTFTKLCFSQFC